VDQQRAGTLVKASVARSGTTGGSEQWLAIAGLLASGMMVGARRQTDIQWLSV